MGRAPWVGGVRGKAPNGHNLSVALGFVKNEDMQPTRAVRA